MKSELAILFGTEVRGEPFYSPKVLGIILVFAVFATALFFIEGYWPGRRH